MYNKRIKIFVLLTALLFLVCLARLTQMQLRDGRLYRERIAELKDEKRRFRQLKTVRGRIFDRKGRVLAVDEPRFQLHINYDFSSALDERVRRAKLLRAAKKSASSARDVSASDPQKELEKSLESLHELIDKCTYFGPERSVIEERIRTINNKMWNLRSFLAWVRNKPNKAILEKYNHRIGDVPFSEAIADFERRFPDPNERLMRVSHVQDIADMDKTWRLLELRTDDDVFTAQLEFLDVDGIEILPRAQRFYPYGSIAAQTIGWVGPAQEYDKKLFASDKLSSYLEDEVCGKRPGVEYVCEAVLRGRRGQRVYDIDRQLVERTETEFGKDVCLAVDIELQKRIEDYLSSSGYDPNCGPGKAAVVIDVGTGDILALVSMPVFDLNGIRRNYSVLIQDANAPLINRALNKQYPPGSAIKPLVLIAGLESGKITAQEVISCPAQKAPKGWPSCWKYNRYRSGHDYDCQNTARNAVKGSCNIYFSRLADRIDPLVLQKWLFQFGYGRATPLAPASCRLYGVASEANDKGRIRTRQPRDFRQAAGIISSGTPRRRISSFAQLPPLQERDRRYFGIGQGNLRVTPLQVANAMAAIAGGGVYKPPRLFHSADDDPNDSQVRTEALNISRETLAVVYDGMHAVVNEQGGTAYREFAHSGFAEQGVEVYGKTGSTEKPDNAWFAGFAKDSAGASISIAVVVEGGQHGSSDAAPLARDIIQFCIEAGYIGQAIPTTQ